MLEDFVKRHMEWHEEADKEELLSDIMGCLDHSKKNFSINVRGKVIYSEVEPEHLIEDILARFISLQFPNYFVVLESSRGTFVSGQGISGVVRTKTKMRKMINKLNTDV